MGKKRPKHKNQKVAEDIYTQMFSDMDDTFAFIAGYTPGGAPYGVTWEQVGIDSELPFEKTAAHSRDFSRELAAQKQNAPNKCSINPCLFTIHMV